ncbi:MAG TPA: Xaa-Pro peptidase family protein [Candidatus Acidoferrales bacterium]|nr:Xaa-Pro peptidase family protein [Candidatus Acidoferrales bacterium]
MRDEKKLSRLRDHMRAENLSALVLRVPENVSYVSDAWPGRGLSYLVIPLEKEPVLIHPSGETLPPTWVKDVKLYNWETYEHLGESLAAGVREVENALRGLGIESGSIGIEEQWEHFLGTPLRYEMMVSGAKTTAAITHGLTSYEVRDVCQLLVQLRSIKTDLEVLALRKANRVAQVGLNSFERNLKPDLSEIELSTGIEQAIITEGILKFRANKVVACAFVASGPLTADGYKYVVGNRSRKLRRGDLVMLELDVVVDGYSSDTTRTFVVGKPNRKQKGLLEAVLESEKSAIEAIKPGVRAAEIARISIDIIRKHGLSEYLVHRLGHGIGVAVHEPLPALHLESGDVLEPGMVHSVEPGIYGEKIGGVRIEDDILDTRTGAEYLSNYPRIQE